jgi:hypothetical protein
MEGRLHAHRPNRRREGSFGRRAGGIPIDQIELIGLGVRHFTEPRVQFNQEAAMENGSGLDSFRGFLDQYRRLILVAIGASAVPLAAALASLTPAWPSGITGVTAVAQLLVLALIFQLLKSSRRAVVSRVMVRSSILLCLLMPVYFFLLNLFTYTEPLSNERFTKGY